MRFAETVWLMSLIGYAIYEFFQGMSSDDAGPAVAARALWRQIGANSTAR